jgi:hypothetical protein
MNTDTKTELENIHKDIVEQINEKLKTVVSAQAKAQIKNLIDKVDTRKKLPDFEIEIPFEDLEVSVTSETSFTLTLSDFLKAINTEASTEDKQELKNLQVREEGLRLTLETMKSVELINEGE